MTAAQPSAWWQDHDTGPIRHEAHYGQRVVRCLSERPASVNGMLASAAGRAGERDAMVFEGRRWTYRQMLDRVTRMAGGLARLGIERGDRVVLFAGNHPDFVFTVYALQWLGAICVPVGIREQRAGLAWMASQCGAVAVVHDAALRERVPDADEAPALRHRLEIDGALWQSLCDGQAIADPADALEEDAAFILYTSGTTGRPKGAMLTHLSIAHSVRHYQACLKLTEQDCGALVVPGSHVTGLVALILTMCQVAGRLLVIREFKAPRFVAEAAAERVSFSVLVPAMYQLCLLHGDLTTHDLSHWRVAGYGGAPMPAATIDELAERLPGMILVNAYGSTETTSPTTIMPLGLGRDRADTVGVPAPCADVLIVDEAGRELPRGESGEIWIGGPMVVPGYWDNPQATADAFTGGYWHSGDIGQMDAAGFVRLFDRKKDMLNRGGFKIYSVEVENTLVAYPGIVEAAVIGRPCPVLGERVHAFVHAADSQRVDIDALRAHCAHLLADYKVPETFTISAEPLPRNANGKLLKRQMRELLDPASASAGA